MKGKLTDELLAAYDSELLRYEAFAQKVRGLIEEIVEEHRSGVHSVTCRVKSRDSFARKVSGKEYSLLSDVTDVCGVRVITYFEEDVDSIAALIENEFEIDRENSVDKRSLIDSDRFGYLSLHLIAVLPLARVTLREYKRFRSLKVEIQIRSILQHAWAEIEHDLGYKTALGVPREVRRRFSRLAGLLEMADEEFSGIRRELRRYEESVGDRIEQSPQAVSLNKASILSFLSNSKLVQSLDKVVASASGVILSSEPSSRLVENGAAWFAAFGIFTIGDLESTLAKERDFITRFSKELSLARNSSFARGVSLAFLFYVMLCRTGRSAEQLVADLARYGWDVDEAVRTAMVNLIHRAYEKVSGSR